MKIGTSDCRKSQFSARYCLELIALSPRHICLRSGSIWQNPSNHRLGFGAAPFPKNQVRFLGDPIYAFQAAAAMSQYLAENGMKLAKNFIAAPPWAMTAGGSRPSLTEARAETAMAKRGTAIKSKWNFLRNRFIDTLRVYLHDRLFFCVLMGSVYAAMNKYTAVAFCPINRILRLHLMHYLS